MSMAYRGNHCPANVYLRGAGEFVEIRGVKQKVQRPCKIQSNGAWFCEAHQKRYEMNTQAWGHTQTVGAHVMVWLCKTHGPEQAGG